MYPYTQGAGYQRSDQRTCFPGTQETPLGAIKSWATNLWSTPSFLVLGLAGTGKSAISQTIAEWCDVNGLLVASYFCSPGADKGGNLRLIFPILATQLAQKHPGIRSALVPLLQFNEGVVYESASNQMKKLIIDPLKSADVPAVIIIDGLDEWIDDTSQSAIISLMSGCIENTKVKFLVTSRPKTHIMDSSLHPLLDCLVHIFLLFDTAPDAINNDIRLFLEHELSGLAFRNGLDNWPTTGELDLLCSRANGLFVYAVATVKFLDQKQVSPIEQYNTIADSPEDTMHEGTVEGVHGGLSLDSLCLLVLQEAYKSNDAEYDAVVRSVLALMVLVDRPLPPSTIAALVHLEVKEVMGILRAIQSLLLFDGDHDQPVHLFHRLVADLLTSPTRCKDKRFYIPPRRFHPEIALNCLKLMNKTLDDGFSLQNRTEDSEVDDPPGETALEYACTTWYTHLAVTREGVTPLVPILRHFLEDKSAVWLTVLDTKQDTAPALGVITCWLREVCLGLLQTVRYTYALQIRWHKINDSSPPLSIWLKGDGPSRIIHR